jgi:hypothetical protein
MWLETVAQTDKFLAHGDLEAGAAMLLAYRGFGVCLAH